MRVNTTSCTCKSADVDDETIDVAGDQQSIAAQMISKCMEMPEQFIMT